MGLLPQPRPPAAASWLHRGVEQVDEAKGRALSILFVDVKLVDLSPGLSAGLSLKDRGGDRIGKMKFKVTNWPEYVADLRQRGSLTVWLTQHQSGQHAVASRATPIWRSRRP